MERSSVGARELKTRLGRYLRRVREGRSIVVTDRGEPIAELRPIAPDASVPAALLKLADRGAITLPTRPAIGAFTPIHSDGPSASQAVIDDRGDRV